VEGFIDELAAAAGKDPLEFRRRLLTGTPRLLGVLNVAAEKAGWGKPLPAGRFRGIAAVSNIGSFNAQVVEISVNQGKLRVQRVVCAVDCGYNVNPAITQQQIEGGIVYGLTAALKGAITIDRGRVQQANFNTYDVIRIDHLRGFDTYWSIPANATNARTGRWEKGPGLAFFKTLHTAMPEAKLIAEDLGELMPSVVALREATGLPGMAILQFAFGGGADNLYLPHNQRSNSAVYPGTHDNDTTLGWYASVAESVRDHVRRYLRVSGREIGWDFVRSAYSSGCNLAVIPLQDLLTLGSDARFNRPGTSQGNWTWRYRPEQLRALSEGASVYLRELAILYGRDGAKKSSPVS